MATDELKQVRAHLRLSQQHAHRTDAERAETEARLHETQAAVLRADAQAARAHAEAVTAHAALAEVRRLCDLTISTSVRVQATQQARDTLDVIDAITGNEPLPGDGAWFSVWLHGNWRYLTSKMTTPEREHAADAVQRYSNHLEGDEAARDDVSELDGLRWWRD